MLLVVTKNIGKSVTAMRGDIAEINNCKVRGKLRDGRAFQMLSIYALDRVVGYRGATWRADNCTLSAEQTAFLNKYCTPE